MEVAAVAVARAAQRQLRAFRLADLHVGLHPLELPGRDQGPISAAGSNPLPMRRFREPSMMALTTSS